VHDLEIARRSQPSVAARQRYYALFTEVSQASQSALAPLWQGLWAQLAWDGRALAAQAGARRIHNKSYRLLYTTERADVELWIEPTNGHRRLVGDVLALDQPDALAPLLVQLHDATTDRVAHETESDATGRFEFDVVAPARYHLQITPLHGAPLHIDALEIT